jgi:hypothetical protein
MNTSRKNIKKKYLLLLAGVILVFMLLFLSVAVLRYSGRVRFYEPITISIQTTDTVHLSEISVCGNTPFGRQIAFSNKENYYCSGDGFLKELVISCPPKTNFDTCIVNIKVGTQIFSHTLSEIKNNWVNNESSGLQSHYSSPTNFQSNGSIFSFFISIFSWRLGRYFLESILALISLILTFFLIRDLKGDFFILLSKVKMNISSRKLFAYCFLFLLFLLLSIVLIYQLFLSGKVHISAGLVAVVWLYVFLTWLMLLLFRKQLKLQQNILLTLTTICLLIFISELSLRFSNLRTYSEKNNNYYKSPYTPENTKWYHVRKANSSFRLKTNEFSFSRNTNSLGLSDLEPKTQKDSNEFLIIGLGESFTEGDGTDADSTWLKFLERSLNKKTIKKTRFINAGICGSDPFYEYVLLRDKLFIYHPDLVIVALGYDLDDIICRGGMERFQKDGTVKFKNPPWWEDIFALSFIFRFVAYNFFDIDYLLLPPEKHNAACENAISQLKESIDLFDVLAKKNDFHLLFVFYPMKEEVLNQKYTYWDDILMYAKSKGSETVNLLDYYVKEVEMNNQNIEKYYWPKDGHNKSAGYKVFAEGIEKGLKEMGTMDSLKSNYMK